MDGILENFSMKLHQNLKNHILVARFTLIVTFILFLLWKFFFNYDIDFFLTVGLFHIIFTIPSIYLHFEYFLKNYKENIELTNDKLIICKNGKIFKFATSDFLRVILYKSASLENRGIPFSAMEYYNYIRIILKTKEEIIISCLFANDLEVVLLENGIEYERKKRFFCSIYWK